MNHVDVKAIEGRADWPEDLLRALAGGFSGAFQLDWMLDRYEQVEKAVARVAR